MTNKLNDMNNILKISLAAMIAVTVIACGSGAKEKKGELGDLKVKLEKLKKEKSTLDADIRKLEEQIAKADPKSSQQVKKLIAIDTVRVNDFKHYIELQGKIDAEGLAMVAPSGQGGAIRAINVRAGQRVSKGQLIVRLDDNGAGQSVIAAQQQVNVLKAELANAQTTYERHQGLWKQNIGSEMQVINAKTRVDALQSQIRAAEAQVGQARGIANMANVYAPISGVVDLLNVKVGEFFSPQSAAKPETGIRIVNNSNLKMVVEVPENYVGRVKIGAPVLVSVPEVGKNDMPTKISMVGAAINPISRGFMTEAKLSSDPLLKPNQTATMKILDYEAKAAISIPVNVVQADEKGKYVYVAERSGDKLVARKRGVEIGEVYGDRMEIKLGLKPGDVIITEGYQTVYDGQAVNTVVATK